MPSDTTFARLLGEGLAFSFDYGDDLTNHELMSLDALHQLGRGELPAGRLEAYARAYRQRLEPVRASDEAFESAYAAAIAERGPIAVAREVLVEFGPALPGAAGHGLLAIYHALEAGPDLPAPIFERHLARALGHHRDRALVLHEGARGSESLLSVLAELPPLADAAQAEIRELPLITLRQAAVSRRPEFVAAAGRIDPHVDVLEAAHALASVALDNPNFTLLHALTTAQAILDLPALVPGLDVGPLGRGYVDFVLAAALTEGLVPLRRGSPTPVDRAAADAELAGILSTTLDDHAPKAAFSLLRLHERTGADVFFGAALAFVRRFD